ncbi:hypothetical protein [Brachybacterium epidermidis]|uniref:hypothetical protein n=1 Tax=Brachybacterium epidermidis TaxID=2781983 RepID=UPI00398F023F
MKPKKPDTISQLSPRPKSSAKPSMSKAFPGNGGGGELVHLTLQVPEELRRRLKATAAAEGTSVRAIVTEALERDLENRTSSR